MSYLLDKNKKIQKYKKISAIIFVAVLLFYFRAGVYRGLSVALHTILKPVLVAGSSVGNGFSNFGVNFHSKKTLLAENENLKTQIAESIADRANYASVVDENIKLKEILGRKPEKMNVVLAGILSRPNQSLYDTLLIDAGSNQGIQVGNIVFAIGNVPIGKIVQVYASSANVILFSNPGEKTDIIISLGHSLTSEASKDIPMQAVGRGGGNFELNIPRDLVVDPTAEIDFKERFK